MIRFALHGGAGVIERSRLSADREADYRHTMEEITQQAKQRLLDGESAAAVVEQAVISLEESPLFNAGYGSVLNADGVVEMDAAIMDGEGRRCGAVAAIARVAHPVSVARALMDEGVHVLLAGRGAQRFAVEQGFALLREEQLIIPERQQQLLAARAENRGSLDHDQDVAPFDPDDITGTVGAVARDLNGGLAAATSTGGMTNKHPGRVGDSPLIGAGTWADNQSVCVSATGHGEYFIRGQVAYDIHAQMTYANASLAAAAASVLSRVGAMGGSGGLIAIDREGQLALPFNSAGMYRAWFGADQVVRVAIYGDE